MNLINLPSANTPKATIKAAIMKNPRTIRLAIRSCLGSMSNVPLTKYCDPGLGGMHAPMFSENQRENVSSLVK
ncbi:hypothetical protein [Pseudomonas sp. IT-P258]|uniref:hypothetical protein n=1 Tax=Pseudomonas sp. IT-P258 TaxID=3026447 RepID=UPI0039E04669